MNHKYLTEILYVSWAGNPLAKRSVIKSDSAENALNKLAAKVEKQKNWMKTNGGNCQLIKS